MVETRSSKQQQLIIEFELFYTNFHKIILISIYEGGQNFTGNKPVMTVFGESRERKITLQISFIKLDHNPSLRSGAALGDEAIENRYR